MYIKLFPYGLQVYQPNWYCPAIHNEGEQIIGSTGKVRGFNRHTHFCVWSNQRCRTYRMRDQKRKTLEINVSKMDALVH